MNIGVISLGCGFLVGAIMTDMDRKGRIMATVIGLLFVAGGML